MPITWEIIAAFITVFGVISGIWWRVEGMIRKNTDDLAAHKLHTAEAYVTKQGMAEQTDRIMKAINDVGTRVETRVDGLGARLDRFYETQPTRSRRAGQ
jgi:hypothetical protein